MSAQVYTFRITYEGLEDRIWRKVAVSSNYRLDQLGYVVLATFDTLAYHLFEFYYAGRRFEIPDEGCMHEQIDMALFKVGNMGLKIGDRIEMDYDFGTTQTFWLELVEIADMPRGQGRRFPYVLDGAGRGIIDDMAYCDLLELIEQIDRNGQTDSPFYYLDDSIPWDYRQFDLKYENTFLKRTTLMNEEGYAPFWN